MMPLDCGWSDIFTCSSLDDPSKHSFRSDNFESSIPLLRASLDFGEGDCGEADGVIMRNADKNQCG